MDNENVCTLFIYRESARDASFGPHVSADRVLPDRGLLEIADAISALDSSPSPAATIADLIEAAKTRDPVAGEAFQLFSEWLGVVAGDLALTAGARSGVYVFSPMVLAWGDLFDRDLCRSSFEAKGRMSGSVTEIHSIWSPSETAVSWACPRSSRRVD